MGQIKVMKFKQVTKSWLKNNDTKICWTHNEGKYVKIY